MVTYREEAGGKLWFPTYSKADEFLAFPKGEVHVREVVKYSSYKTLDSWNQEPARSCQISYQIRTRSAGAR